MAMGIDHSGNEYAVEKFDPFAGVDGFPGGDLNHPSLSVEREYRRAQKPLWCPKQMGGNLS